NASAQSLRRKTRAKGEPARANVATKCARFFPASVKPLRSQGRICNRRGHAALDQAFERGSDEMLDARCQAPTNLDTNPWRHSKESAVFWVALDAVSLSL